MFFSIAVGGECCTDLPVYLYVVLSTLICKKVGLLVKCIVDPSECLGYTLCVAEMVCETVLPLCFGNVPVCDVRTSKCKYF
jgi:hypothetical protein